ncbi:FG-GAP repeat domain-containing protein [Glycomyces mayteni]|uniref:FG-GAP repeat domain-containing protein n=1 Tax=Glycomyces mayteni TaxID=543887 RepID=A0ABW2DAH1_9ACTN|nr:hypothetical protein GCM10025732_10880 [Glycomyces mayteni]
MNAPVTGTRRRTSARTAAALTAAALGAAILAAPAAAQTGSTDCAALGDDPAAAGLESALQAARDCGVEVRLTGRSTPYATVYVTPENRLHYVATTAPVQGHAEAGALDPTLVAADGALAPAATDWPFRLPYDAAGLPLLDTPYAELYWDGATPVPAYSGTTAAYRGLAPGLDFAADVDTAAADLRFTVADRAAWDAVAEGLAVGPEDSAYVTDSGALAVFADTDYAYGVQVEGTTPFTVRDADGAVTPAEIEQDESGALTVTVPEEVLATAAYPLELTAQWALREFPVPGWGSVTSAAELALHRGEGGLDEPYFEAAGETGDVLAGPYCDALADPACETVHQAASYWSFPWPMIESLRATAVEGFTYPVASASFRIDAAEGAECRAPDLARPAGYLLTTTWSSRPSATGATAAGTCADGTAAYDVSDLLAPVWSNGNSDYSPALLAMADSAETARFDGATARLDVYFDIVGYLFSIPTSSCGTSSAPRYYRSAVASLGGDHRIETWRPDLIDLGLTWSAEVFDAYTGEPVAAAGPLDAPDGSRPAGQLDEPLGPGRYRAVYTVESSTTAFSTVKTCYFGVDTAWPEVVGVAVAPGPHYIGDTVAVDVTVSDDGFPDGRAEIDVACASGDLCDGVETVVLRDGTTAEFAFELRDGSGVASFRATDDAGQYDYSSTVVIPATVNTYDYNGDRFQDLYLVRKSDGHLLFYPGKGDGALGTAVSRGGGWNAMDVVMAGDLTGDGDPDLLARDTRTGNLYTYPGDGAGNFEPRILAGGGWNAISVFTSAADFDGNGTVDLFAIRESDGRLLFHPGKGDGTFGARTFPALPTGGNGWGSYTGMMTLSPRGNNDALPDLLLRDTNGDYQVLNGNGRGGVENSTAALGMATVRSDGTYRTYAQITAAGDQNADGRDDFVAVDARTGELLLIAGADYTPAVTVLSKTGGAFRVPAVDAADPYDYTGDLHTDVYGLRAADGVLKIYEGAGSGLVAGDDVAYVGGADLVETAGDMTGDGLPDLLVRWEGGDLEVFRGGIGGNFNRGIGAVGTGWHKMSALVSGQDFNGDGKVDIVAREAATGYLWLYPGKGDGTVGARVKTGSGWNAMRELTAVGDLDHDGHADLLAVRTSDNCLYRYDSTGTGALQSGVKVGCGWAGLDALASVGDFDGDGHADLAARRNSDGKLFLYKGNGAGGFASAVAIGTGWNRMSTIA